MRSVPVHHNKNFGAAKDVQKEGMKKSKENAEKDVESRLKSKKSGDILVTINNASQEFAKYLDEAAKQGMTWTGGFDKSKVDPETLKKGERMKKKLQDTIMPQIKGLDNYIQKLSKSTRFKNVRGPLYDPNTGWNPGYRVFAKDLTTIIPLKPFEALHKTNDIYFGKPTEAESESIGFMPFTWIQDGAKISVHPILYELARAKAIREIYKKYLEGWDGVSFWSGRAKAVDPKEYAKYWTEWNSALVSHKIGGYDKENDVLFKDRFGKFLKKLRAGQIQGKDNNLGTAKNQAQGAFGEYVENLSNSVASGDIMGAGLKSGFNPLVMGAAMGVAAYKDVKKKVENVKRIFNYDKGDPNLEYKEGDSWWERRKKDAKRLARKASAAATVASWRGTKAAGVEYGDVRDFWLDSGALDLFANSTIMGTTGAAIPLIDFLIKKDLLPKAPGAKNSNRIHDLMHWFYKTAGIKGYDWKQVVGDEASQAGFAQTFLEYLKYKVLPQWNKVEQLLSDEITYKTQDTNAKLLKGVVKLNTLMSQKSLFDFMYKHLRFPNMEIRLIDYSNANSDDRKKLDKFRKEMGIPDAKGKNSILKDWQGIWGKIGKMSDEELDKTINNLKHLMQKAEFEARFSGDYTYLKQLKQCWDKLEKEKQARLDAQASGDKIVKKSGDV